MLSLTSLRPPLLAASLLAAPLAAQQAVEFDALRVAVLDPEGQPVAGAVVEVFRFEGGDALYSNLDIDETNESRLVTKLPTPKSGRIGIQVPVAVPHRLRVDVPPFAIEYRRGVFAGEAIEIRLRPGGVVCGVVTDNAGVALPGAKVEMFFKPRTAKFEALTDADGGFRFERVMPGSAFVDVDAPQAASDRGQTVAIVSGETTDLKFGLERGAEVRGRVVDAATGKPIAGARFGVGWTYDKAVATDADGKFRWFGLGGPFSNNLFLYKPGYCELQIDRPKPEGKVVELELALERGIAVEGRLVDLDGRPANGAYVAVVGMTHDGRRQETDWLSVRTDATGRFALRGVRPKLEPVLLVRHELRATLVLPLPEAVEQKVELGDIPLRPRRILQGVFVGADGSPLVGEKVQLVGCNTEAPPHVAGAGGGLANILGSYLAARDTVTDSRGRFYFGDLAAGTYTVKVGGSESEVRVLADTDPQPLEIRN